MFSFKIISILNYNNDESSRIAWNRVNILLIKTRRTPFFSHLLFNFSDSFLIEFIPKII